MAEAAPFSVRDTGNPYIDALLWGSRWDLTPGPITFELWEDGSSFPWSDAERSAFRQAFTSWAEVADITFRERVGVPTDLNVVLDRLPPGIYATASGPNGGLDDGLITFNPTAFEDWSGQLRPGGFAYDVILHEIGHALGLAHPHDLAGRSGVFPGVTVDNPDDRGTFGLNTALYTVMSYNDVGEWWAPEREHDRGFPATPMAFDIAAIQSIYGANLETRTGNDVYALPGANGRGTSYACIWDAGGTDTISYTGRRDATIDLRAAPLEGRNAGGYLSHAEGILGGFTIANGVQIERARAGSGDDVLFGNDGANVLYGGAGADRMTGGAGNDTYHVDNIADRAIEGSGAGGFDTVISTVAFTLGAGLERLILRGGATVGTGNGGGNVLLGGARADQLSGMAGADTLVGGAAGDGLHGGTGVDTVLYTASRSGVIVDLAAGLGRSGDARDDVLTSIEHLLGSRHNDRLIGSNGANSLTGGAGNDLLDGGAGADRLRGDAGNDRIYGGDWADYIVAGSGDDIVYGGNGADRIYGTAGANRLDGGNAGDLVRGGSGNDRIFGGAGGDSLLGGLGDDLVRGGDHADILYGGGDDDSLLGDGGADLLRGDAGDDLLDGGSGRDTAFFTGDRADYEITGLAPGEARVRDLRPADAGNEGADRLLDIELLRFRDGVIETAAAAAPIGSPSGDPLTLLG
jgi:serralysin